MVRGVKENPSPVLPNGGPDAFQTSPVGVDYDSKLGPVGWYIGSNIMGDAHEGLPIGQVDYRGLKRQIPGCHHPR